jgi:hypothetical protein
MPNPIFTTKKVQRKQAKASIAIDGLPGSGKSGLALMLGKALANNDWTKVAAIDTESSSLNLFDGITANDGELFENFQIGDFTPDIGYKPSHYEAFKEAAIEGGADVVIFDSLTHAWMARGGVLDILNKVKKTTNDSYAAWGDPEVVREKTLLLELLRDSRVHTISTVRVKEKMEYIEGESGKRKLSSLGDQQIMQADMKYEPDLVLSMISPGKNRSGLIKHPVAIVDKSRYAIFDEEQEYEFTPQLCEQLREYLNEGTSPEELLAQQHKEFVENVTAYLDANQNKVNIWKLVKEQNGFEDTKLADIPLPDLKTMFTQLIT